MPCGCVLLAYVGLSILDGHPRTLTIQINEWQNTSWGFHAINRQEARFEIAVSADGSRRNRCDARYFKNLVIPDGSFHFHSLYLRPQNAGYEIHDEIRTIKGGECSCVWESIVAAPANSNDCADRAAAEMANPSRTGTSRIAGLRVVHYRETDEQGTVSQVAYAPEAACEIMEHITTFQGTLGIPGGRRSYVVTSYIRGEPGPGSFILPAGYSVIQR